MSNTPILATSSYFECLEAMCGLALDVFCFVSKSDVCGRMYKPLSCFGFFIPFLFFLTGRNNIQAPGADAGVFIPQHSPDELMTS